MSYIICHIFMSVTATTDTCLAVRLGFDERS